MTNGYALGSVALQQRQSKRGWAWRALEVAGQAAFAIRYQGHVYAYLNQCRHIPVEMDYRDGDFFDLSKHYLICALHGATYQPDTGLCVRGPCRGSRLHSVKVEERDGQVYLVPPACNGENSQ